MKLTAKYLFVALLASTAGVQAYHTDYDYVNSGDCCPSRCYECSCNPLYCGAWDLQIHGGANFIKWRNRGDFFAVNCNLDPAVVNNGQLLNFKHFYKTPWIVGGQIGHHWSDNVRAYVEFNYSQAKARTVEVAATVPDIVLEFTTLSKYKVFDAYFGTRYYWDRWCDRVAFFLGAKVGLTHHKSDSTDVTIQTPSVNPPVVIASNATVFLSNTVVSGGADFGLDICFCGNWSFVITGAILASCGPRSAQFLDTVNTPVTNLLLASVGTELRFPVTAGIRYSF